MDYEAMHRLNTEIREHVFGDSYGGPDALKQLLYDTIDVATCVSAFVSALKDDFRCLTEEQITEAMKIYTDHLMRAKVSKWTRLHHWGDK